MSESTSNKLGSMTLGVLGVFFACSVYLVGCIALAGLSYSRELDRAMGA